MVDGARVFLLRTTMRENRACAAVSSLNVGATRRMLHFRPSFLRPQEQTRGHCTMAFCCTVQRSSVLVVKRPEVPCCGQPSFLSFQNLPPALLLKHPFPINNRHGRSRSFWFCRRKAVFALSKAELRQTCQLRGPALERMSHQSQRPSPFGSPARSAHEDILQNFTICINEFEREREREREKEREKFIDNQIDD